MTRNLVLHVPTRCSWEQRGVLTHGSRSMVATCWRRERPGSFLRARDFLTALLLQHWRLTERVPPRGHTPWIHGTFLRRRWPGRRRGFTARAGRGAVQRNGRRRRAPCGADKLGDAVEPFFVDVVDGAVAQELVRRDECSSSLHGRAERMGQRTSWGERGSCGAAVLPHGRMLGRCVMLVPRRAGGDVDGRRRGTARTPADRGRLGDAGSERGPALGAGPTSVRHGRDGRRRTGWWKTNHGTPLPGAPNVGFRVPADP